MDPVVITRSAPAFAQTVYAVFKEASMPTASKAASAPLFAVNFFIDKMVVFF